MTECFSVVYWKDLSTEALSTCLWLFKAKVNGYLNCNDIVQCVHVSSYLFTMMTLFLFVRRCAVIQHIAEHVVSFLFFIFLFVFSVFWHSIKLSMASAFMWSLLCTKTWGNHIFHHYLSYAFWNVLTDQNS